MVAPAQCPSACQTIVSRGSSRTDIAVVSLKPNSSRRHDCAMSCRVECPPCSCLCTQFPAGVSSCIEAQIIPSLPRATASRTGCMVGCHIIAASRALINDRTLRACALQRQPLLHPGFNQRATFAAHRFGGFRTFSSTPCARSPLLHGHVQVFTSLFTIAALNS